VPLMLTSAYQLKIFDCLRRRLGIDRWKFINGLTLLYRLLVTSIPSMTLENQVPTRRMVCFYLLISTIS
jgi:hypothetical protein